MSATRPPFLFAALGISPASKVKIEDLAKRSGISIKRLKTFETEHKIPSKRELVKLAKAVGKSVEEVMLSLGSPDRRLLKIIQRHSIEIHKLIKSDLDEADPKVKKPPLVFKTDLGKLYRGDCLDLMRTLEDESFNLIFADPPFNLNKLYPSRMDDNLKEETYIEWCEDWASECARLLKEGGSLLIWNLPKWNIHIGDFLQSELNFRHWVAVDVKYSLPISGRLYPSHYSLLYFTKGEKPSHFKPDRLPMEICHSCGADLKDYGGYKDKMNPRGISLTDVWYDISPVRHAKYKKRSGANELPIKLLDRIIEMTTQVNDMVFDPFGGSGTTYITAELKKRQWMGIELGPVADIVDRFEKIDEDKEYLERIRASYNQLFLPEGKKLRQKRGLWTVESVRSSSKGVEEITQDLFLTPKLD